MDLGSAGASSYLFETATSSLGYHALQATEFLQMSESTVGFRFLFGPLTRAALLAMAASCSGSSESNEPGGGPSAQTDAGKCPEDQAQCGSGCVSLEKDPAYCGTCYSACDVGQVCSRGRCMVSCQPGLTNCSGACSDLKTDRQDCGACGHSCAQGQVCSASK